MDKFRKINNFDIQLLNGFPGLTVYDNQLFLNDSIDYKWATIFRMFPTLPAKVRFTVILMCVGGEGHARISGNKYLVKENDVIMVSLGNIIETVEVSDDFKAISVAILPESSLMSFTYSSARFLRDSLYDPKVLRLSPQEGQRMVSFFSTVKNIIVQESDMFKLEALQGAYIMLASYLSSRLALQKKHVAEHKVTKWRSNELLRRFLTELSQNYTFERSVQFYAQKLFISPKYFAQMIYKESGKHAKDWIRDFVIKDAKTMLKSGNYTVQEVSETLHFANQSFFGKYFKEAVGCSPMAYKERVISDSSEGHGSPQEEPHHQA
ncbi:MAG TPA: hypothetical protein DDX40_07375 [Rikenellaceae bacterium]|nr:hypothetical protein [Rikenellaceae bacterium]